MFCARSRASPWHSCASTAYNCLPESTKSTACSQPVFDGCHVLDHGFGCAESRAPCSPLNTPLKKLPNLNDHAPICRGSRKKKSWPSHAVGVHESHTSCADVHFADQVRHWFLSLHVCSPNPSRSSGRCCEWVEPMRVSCWLQAAVRLLHEADGREPRTVLRYHDMVKTFSPENTTFFSNVHPSRSHPPLRANAEVIPSALTTKSASYQMSNRHHDSCHSQLALCRSTLAGRHTDKLVVTATCCGVVW